MINDTDLFGDMKEQRERQRRETVDFQSFSITEEKGEILDVLWQPLGPAGCMGFIKVKKSDGEIKYYAGYCQGVSEELDALYIRDWGSSVDPEYIKHFFNL